LLKDEALHGRPRIKISSKAHHSSNIQLFQVNNPYFRQKLTGPGQILISQLLKAGAQPFELLLAKMNSPQMRNDEGEYE